MTTIILWQIFFVVYQRLNIVYLARCNYTCSVLIPITRSQKKHTPIDGEPLMWFHSLLNHTKPCFFRLVVGFSISERGLNGIICGSAFFFFGFSDLMSHFSTGHREKHTTPEYVVSSNDQQHVIYTSQLVFPVFSYVFHMLPWFIGLV